MPRRVPVVAVFEHLIIIRMLMAYMGDRGEPHRNGWRQSAQLAVIGLVADCLGIGHGRPGNQQRQRLVDRFAPSGGGPLHS